MELKRKKRADVHAARVGRGRGAHAAAGHVPGMHARGVVAKGGEGEVG